MIEVFANRHLLLVRNLYRTELQRFPFIGAVLTGIQRGRVWVDDIAAPRTAFVCHDFGWSQLIGAPEERFLEQLQSFLFDEESFSSVKLRIFAPNHAPAFDPYCERSERQQFELKKARCDTLDEILDGCSVVEISKENGSVVSDALGLSLFDRNWPSSEAFFANSFGFAAIVDGHVVASCYSCAEMDGIHEIDILTVPSYRRFGLARHLALRFIAECHKRGFTPNWDCFTNNAGSMALSKSLGFVARSGPVPFFTYNRRFSSVN